ncbi:retrovirus-related pol polyprotein from transposon TNT 1-94 [Tanacetum coccineum]
MTGLQCNKFRGDKGKIIRVLPIRVMLQIQGEILQVGRQELLNATTAKEKAMLAEAQEAGQILDKEQLAFLADPGIPASQAQTIIPHNVPNSKTYLNDMDNQSATVQDTNLQAQQDSMILSVIEQMSEQMINHVNNWEMANKEQNNKSITAELESYKERVKTFEQRLNIDLSCHKKMIDSQMDDMIREKLALKEQIDSLKQNLSKQIKEKESVLQTLAVFKNKSKEKENKYMENEIDLENKIKELDNIISSYSSPVIVEVPSELPKVSLVNASLKKLKFHLTQFDSVVKKRTTPSALKEGEWEFEHTKAVFNKEIIPFLKSLKEIFNVFDKDLLNEIIEVQTAFDQMEAYEVFQNEKSCVNHNAVEIQEHFEINDLKARLQDKDMAICKLKDTIKSLEKNTKEKNVHHEKCDLEPINKELVNSVAKLLSENEQLWNEINHVKQIFKDQFDSIKQTRVHHKEQCDSLINKLNLKSVENKDLKAQIQDKEVHHKTILGNTQEQSNILRGIVEQVKAKQPLDGDLDLACKYAIRIQELLVYVQDTYPNAITPSTKKVVVTPMNNVKKVRLVEPLTSSSNIKQVKSSNSLDSNTPVLSSTRVKCSTSICGSKPLGSKKNDRISSLVDANSDILCATCNESMFDGVHDKCSSKKAKIVESKNANHSEPNQTWGSNATDIPSSSSLVMTGCPDCTLIRERPDFKDYGGMVTISWEMLLSQGFTTLRDLDIIWSRYTNWYTISLDDMLKSSMICLLSKASKTKSWLWHRRLSYLNFGLLNKLAKDGLARGIPRLKFQKDHLCLACTL